MMKNYIEKLFSIRRVFLCAILAALLLAVFPSEAMAQSPHPVDRWIEGCIAQDSSTMGMLSCLDEGYSRWDSELNFMYQGLRGLLNQQQKEALKKAQRAWIAYRDAEFETINLIYGSLQGSMWRLAAMSAKVEMVKARTLDLQAYSESLQEGR
ncbi:MAG: DUF1311 domain-containing protein [bacterium]|nr:DUF1311 domain-containing protein [bacterium]